MMFSFPSLQMIQLVKTGIELLLRLGFVATSTKSLFAIVLLVTFTKPFRIPMPAPSLSATKQLSIVQLSLLETP